MPPPPPPPPPPPHPQGPPPQQTPPSPVSYLRGIPSLLYDIVAELTARISDQLLEGGDASGTRCSAPMAACTNVRDSHPVDDFINRTEPAAAWPRIKTISIFQSPAALSREKRDLYDRFPSANRTHRLAFHAPEGTKSTYSRPQPVPRPKNGATA